MQRLIYERSAGCVIYEFITFEYAFDVEKSCKNKETELKKKIQNSNEPLPTLEEGHTLQPILEK